ncbi:hypothetical protein HQO84_05395 [Rhodococcus fascians]|nr:hypothetical protein [Rhodococcus fascians]MBY3999579.1 hypothetical protein [Rhodococcus fascians]MBY4001209.1 hypothetical protein [Rhodococcus fascians]MBY4009520.1 hypothetical protein [Rhodococcus fascians]MBY4015369.1 hypothetical protein [Rhodococcus fascians]
MSDDAEAIAAAKAQAAEATAESERLAAEKVRLKFVHENRVPPVVADRLRGSTVEELADDWSAIKPGLLAASTQAPDPNGPRVPAPVKHQGAQPARHITMDDVFYESIYGRKG